MRAYRGRRLMAGDSDASRSACAGAARTRKEPLGGLEGPTTSGWLLRRPVEIFDLDPQRCLDGLRQLLCSHTHVYPKVAILEGGQHERDRW